MLDNYKTMLVSGGGLAAVAADIMAGLRCLRMLRPIPNNMMRKSSNAWPKK